MLRLSLDSNDRNREGVAPPKKSELSTTVPALAARAAQVGVEERLGVALGAKPGSDLVGREAARADALPELSDQIRARAEQLLRLRRRRALRAERPGSQTYERGDHQQPRGEMTHSSDYNCRGIARGGDGGEGSGRAGTRTPDLCCVKAAL